MHKLKQIFEEFEKQNVNYCHFKSNQHLDKSFIGKSDFDILIDIDDKSMCDMILTKFNCKKFEPVGIGIYPGVENWYVFDNVSGNLFHLHLHYQIATGKQYIKDYILPWGNIVLDTSIKNEEYGIYISKPSVEILLLLTRIVVKSRITDRLKSIFGLYRTHESLREEYEYLKEKAELYDIERTARLMFSSKTVEILLAIIKKPSISSRDYKLLSKVIRRELKNNRRMNPIKASFLSLYYRFVKKYNKVKNKLGMFTIDRKTTITGGRIISFIGVDGSGKSTLNKEINQWLIKGKVENKRVYMGTGDGKKPFLARMVGLMKKRYQKSGKQHNKKSSASRQNEISFIKNPLTYIKNVLNVIEIYSVVKSNRRKIIKMHRYRINGGVSIVDRYPQLQQPDMNDGLKLKKFSQLMNNKFIKNLEKKEYNLVKIVDSIYPDIVFRLNISAEVSMKRKPEENTDYDYLNYKATSLKNLEFKKSLLYEINAEKSYDEVLLEIKEIIWNNF